MLRLRTNSVHLCFYVYVGIHLTHCGRSCGRLGFLSTTTTTNTTTSTTTTTTTKTTTTTAVAVVVVVQLQQQGLLLLLYMNVYIGIHPMHCCCSCRWLGTLPTLYYLVALCKYSKFRIESNSYISIRFNSKRAQLLEIFEYLPSPISYLFNRMTLIFHLSNHA